MKSSDLSILSIDEIKKIIRDVPDFPKPGILFKDITPLLENPRVFKGIIDLLASRYVSHGIQKIVCVESRGFIFGAPLAVAMGVGCIVVRKPGKLPYKTDRVSYELEYGTDSLEMHHDTIKPQDKILLVDDLLATGGTMTAVKTLVERQGGVITESAFVIELEFLKGRARLAPMPVYSLVQY